MKRQKPGVGSVVLAAFAVLVGLMLFGGLFRLLLAAGVVFVIWKVFFDRGPEVARAPALPERLEVLAPPLDLEAHEPDAELAQLDRELERAIQMAKSQQKEASATT